jgi:glycerol-1-phosphate dehydrogenase [NAD(P)+]
VPLLARNVPGPLSVHVRRGALADLAALLADGRISTAGRVAVAVGNGVGDAVGTVLAEQLPDAPVHRVDGGSLPSARRLADALRGRGFDALVGIGGGGSLDVAKWAATAVGLPFVAVATTLTHDGLASPVASLEEEGMKGSFGVHLPIAVIVDLDLVAGSPVRHTASGIGEAVSNLSAVADWALARDLIDEPYDGLAAAMASSAGLAVLNDPGGVADESFLATLADALIMSGLAMSAAGTSRPCSGACHEISHAIDALLPGTALHGEQVAVGVLFASFLRGDPRLARVDACFRRHGVPRVPADIGLDPARFTEAVIAAPDSRPGRFTILEHLALDAAETRRRVDDFIEAFG